MALQHLRSSTANKRPTPAAMSDGQLAMNTNTASPGLFFKDSNGDSIKAGPAHVGTTAPNATPGAGGQAGNSKGELWLDTTGGTYVLKAWDGTAWRSVSLTGDFVETTGDTMTGALVMDDQGQVRFRETTANGTSYVALQAAASVASNKTITLPDATGTVVLSGAIVNADINTSAAIALSKLATGALPAGITVASTNIANDTIVNADINASAAIVDTKLATISTAGKVADSALPATISSNITGNAATATTLATARTIGGVSFNGSANINLPGVNAAGNQNTTGNATTATSLSSNRTFALTGDVTGSVSSNLSSGASIPVVIKAGIIDNDNISASAAIADTKLATISTAGKVADSALPATISSDITGNAATVTNGVYTNANATITAQHSHQTSNTAIANSTGSLARLEVIGTGGAAFLQFHRPNDFATYFGLDSDNQFKIGGWSYGNASYPILHSANYNSYAPTLGGSGASGTWNINITGTAAAATTVAAGALLVSAGAVGAYQNARSPNTTVGVNGSIAGSNLQTAGGSQYGNPAFGGTWRCMAGPNSGAVNAGSIGLWQRIA